MGGGCGPAMRYRKLRIAWSVVWGVVVVLLCMLWVRSQSDIRKAPTTQDSGRMDRNLDALFARSYNAQNVGDFESGIAIPDWAIIAPVLLIGVLPWIQRAKRFSLRTLLIAATLVAAVLGLIMWLR